MLDLRLYKPSGVFVDTDRNSEEMNLVYPDDPTAKSIEVIAGKVVKFMLTEKGSDAFDPDYGGTSMHYTQMSQIFFPQFKREVRTDVENCIRYIKDAEFYQDVRGELLTRVRILKIVYEPRLTPWRVDVYLEILTNYGNRAVVALNPRTGGDYSSAGSSPVAR